VGGNWVRGWLGLGLVFPGASPLSPFFYFLFSFFPISSLFSKVFLKRDFKSFWRKTKYIDKKQASK